MDAAVSELAHGQLRTIVGELTVFQRRPNWCAPLHNRAITPDEFELLSDEELERLLPRKVREYFPGKDFCADGYFYLHDGTAWSFYKGGFLDE